MENQMLYIGLVFTGLAFLVEMAGSLALFGLFGFGVYTAIFDNGLLGLSFIGGASVGGFILPLIVAAIRGIAHVCYKNVEPLS